MLDLQIVRRAWLKRRVLKGFIPHVCSLFSSAQAPALFACSIKRQMSGRKYIHISSGAESAQAPVQAPAPEPVTAPAPALLTAPTPAPVQAPSALPVTAPASALSQAQMPAPVTAPALQPSAAPAPASQLKEQLSSVLAPSKSQAAASVPAPAPLQSVQHPKTLGKMKKTLKLSFDVEIAAAAAQGPMPAQSAGPTAGGPTGMPAGNTEQGRSTHF